MTATEKISRAEHWRIGKDNGWNGVFIVPVDGELWHVILADGGGWRHLAASNLAKNQRPPLAVVERLRSYFYDDETWVVYYLPPLGAHIGTPFTLHLWESIDEEMPAPVGEKSMLILE